MLNQYLQRTQLLLTDMKQEILNPAFLTMFINTARGQIAGEAECIRANIPIPTVIGSVGDYSFSGLTLFGNAGIGGVINIRSMRYQVGSGTLWISPRPWDWFELYNLNNAAPVSGAPQEWSQYGQGAAAGATGSGNSGTFFIFPPPDDVYQLGCDCTCYPIALVDDTTIEAIPYLWTDAVPYYSAYLAYLYVQNAGASKNMMDMYGTFMKRARTAATPATGGWQYEQANDPAQLSKFAKPGAA